ncbi:MAG TPA: alpha/beta fold hydrolase [Candidatus Binataceae bacterium]
MPFFDSDGVRICYEDQGGGDAVVLVHGFASTARHNWRDTGWIDLLAERYRVLAPDVRGHGQSDRPHTRDAYGYSGMGADAIRLLDHLGIRRALLMGYSMGGSIAISLMLSHPERLRAIVLGGIAYDDGLDDPADRQLIVDAYRARDIAQVTSPLARGYRQFAEAQGNDLEALAALMEGERTLAPPAKFAAVRMPVMIVVGTRDNMIGDPKPLAAMIPGSRLVMLEGRDHLNAPTDNHFKESVLDFFHSAPP